MVSTQHSEDSETAGLLCWNVQGWNNLYKLDRSEVEDLEKTDIICLCETFLTSDINESMCPGFMKNYVIVSERATKDKEKGRGSGGLAIFVRKNCLNAISSDKYDVKILESCPSWIFIRFKNSKNNLYYVVGLIYLKPSTDFKLILEMLGNTIFDIRVLYPNETVLVCGDFNCRVGELNNVEELLVADNPNLYHSRKTLDKVVRPEGRALVDMMEDNGFLALNGRTIGDIPAQYTYVSRTGNSVVDFVWINADDAVLVGSFQVKNYFVSDHHPCQTHFMLKQCTHRSGPTTPRPPQVIKEIFKLPENKNNAFYNVMKHSYRLDLVENKHNSDKMYKNFLSATKECGRFLGMYKQIKVNSDNTPTRNNWFDFECKEHKKLVGRLFQTCKESNFSTNERTEYLKEKRNYKTLIIKKKKEHRNRITQKFNNVQNPQQFWNAYRQATKSVRKQTVPKISLENLQVYYTNFYRTDRLLYEHDLIDVRHPYLDKDITRVELHRAISQARNGKATGTDGVGNEVYKALPIDWVEYLRILFNNVLNTENVPKGWGDVRMCHLFKKGDPLQVENYRPIALMNCICKIFTYIINNRLITYAESASILPESQNGFRRGRSCMDNIFVLNSIINNNLRLPKRKVYALFIDFKKAFDSVSHELLWQELFSKGVSSKIIRIIRNLYKNANIIIDGQSGDERLTSITKGVLQGDCLSPTLYILFTSGLENYLLSRGARGVAVDEGDDVLMLQYADDIVMLSDSPSSLQKNLNILNDYCNEMNLRLNPEKSKIVVFRRGANLGKQTFQFGSENIEIVNKYEYLGVTFHFNGSFNEHVRSVITRSKITAGMVGGVINRNGVENWSCIRKLYCSTVVPTFTYCMAVWGVRYKQELEKIQLNFFKNLFYIKRNTAGHIVRIEIGINKIDFILIREILLYVKRVSKLPVKRLPHRALKRLIKVHDSGPVAKYNWVSQILVDLKSKGIECEGHSFLSIDDDTIHSILTRLEKWSWDSDWDRILLSVNYPQYKHINSITCRYDLCGTAIPFYLRRFYLQLRTSFDTVMRMYFGGITYVIDAGKKCSICNLNEYETLSHILFTCPIYKEFRNRLVGLDAEVTQLLKSTDREVIKAVHRYIYQCMRLRAFVMGEGDW